MRAMMKCSVEDEEQMRRAAELKSLAYGTVEREAASLLALSHRISDHPEIGLQEVHAAAWLLEAVRTVPGVRTEAGLAGMPTSFVAEIGTGELVVTLCAEYDALPGVGHGCGHNIIAAAAVGAFLALAPMAEALDATFRLLGTPAEENEGGKIRLLQAGAFEGTHLAMMVHPGPIDEASMNPYASAVVEARFTGREAHASLAPHEGVNALDALTIALTAIGLARQQLAPGQQIHGTVVDGGGAPNIIPGTTAGLWMIRATDLTSLHEVRERLENCLRGGALAAGCEVYISHDELAYHDLRIDRPLTELYLDNARSVGRNPSGVAARGGSTDMGNISQVFPSIHPMIGLGDAGLVLHTREFAKAARGPEGDRAALDGARLLSGVAIDACVDSVHRNRLISRAMPDPESTDE
ncbi:amidohydrolase [Streptomyces sp. NPDC001933]|uniref:amidohydrolase n=1 Tax=Streptomyces sp. NPDC001933 TaxID=3364626 RepID=UPI0036A5910F